MKEQTITEHFTLTKNEYGTHIIFVKIIDNIKIRFRGSILPNEEYKIRCFREDEIDDRI